VSVKFAAEAALATHKPVKMAKPIFIVQSPKMFELPSADIHHGIR
jgi:hypothetical protein